MMSALHPELCETISALQTYEHLIIGSLYPIKNFCDHKPPRYFRERKKFCLTSSSVTKWLLLISLIHKSIGLLEKNYRFLICSVEKCFYWWNWMVINWLIKQFLRVSDSSTKADMKFKNWLTTTALLMRETITFIQLSAHIRVKQKHFTTLPYKIWYWRDLYKFWFEVIANSF